MQFFDQIKLKIRTDKELRKKEKKGSIESYLKDCIGIHVKYVYGLHPCPHATKWIELNLETDTIDN